MDDSITLKDIQDAVERLMNLPYQMPRCGYCGAEIGGPHNKLFSLYSMKEHICPMERLERIVNS